MLGLMLVFQTKVHRLMQVLNLLYLEVIQEQLGLLVRREQQVHKVHKVQPELQVQQVLKVLKVVLDHKVLQVLLVTQVHLVEQHLNINSILLLVMLIQVLVN